MRDKQLPLAMFRLGRTPGLMGCWLATVSPSRLLVRRRTDARIERAVSGVRAVAARP
jgi:hypothetical protein